MLSHMVVKQKFEGKRLMTGRVARNLGESYRCSENEITLVHILYNKVIVLLYLMGD